MREVRHNDPNAVLPPPKPAPMSAEALTELSTQLFRVQGEIQLQAARFGSVWASLAHRQTEEFHGLVLALLTVREQPDLFTARQLEVVQ